MKWPEPFNTEGWPSEENILLWYDCPVAWLAQARGKPSLVIWVESDEDDNEVERGRTYLATTISEEHRNLILRDTKPWSEICQESRGPFFVVHENWHKDSATVREVKREDINPEWWPTDTSEDIDDNK